jgi:hypothetical protein
MAGIKFERAWLIVSIHFFRTIWRALRIVNMFLTKE